MADTRFNVHVALSSKEYEAGAEGIRRGSNRAETGVAGLDRRVSTLVKTLAVGFTGVAFVSLLRRIVSESVQAEDAQQKLASIVEATGRKAGFTARELASLATQIQSVTRFSDEAVQGAEATLLRFTRIQGDVYTRALGTVVDVAAGTGRDLETIALGIGKSLEIPGEALRALQQAGIILTDSQQKALDKMVAQGKVVEAQNHILALLESRFKGAAVAAGQTLGGQLDRLKNISGELLETIGAGGLSDAIGDLAELMIDWSEDPQTVAMFQQLGAAMGEFLREGVEKALELLPSLISFLEFLGHNMDLIVLAAKGYIALRIWVWLEATAVGARLAAIATFDLSGAIAAVRAGYGGLVALNIIEWAKGAAASMGGLATATNLVGGAIIALLLLINKLIVRWGEASSAAMDYMVKWGEIQGRAFSFSRALSQGGGIVDRKAFDQAKQDLAQLGSELDGARKKVEALRAIQADNPDSFGGDAERLAEAEANVNSLSVAYDTLSKALEKVKKVREGEADPKGGGGGGGLGGPSADQLEKYARLVEQIESAIAAQRKIADAYRGGTAAGEAATVAMEAEAKARQAAADLTKAQRARILELAGALAAEERATRGTSRIAAMKEEVKQQAAIQGAYRKSAAAGAAMERRLEQERRIREQVGDAIGDQAKELEDLARIVMKSEATSAFERTRAALELEIAQLEQRTAAYRRGAGAVAEMTAAQEVQNSVAAASVGLEKAEAAAIEELIRRRARLIQQEKETKINAELQAEIKHLKELLSIRRDQFRTEAQYQAAVAEVNLQYDIQNRLTREGIDATTERGATIKRLMEEEADLAAKLAKHQQQGKTATERWADLGNVLANSFRSGNEELDNLVNGIGKAIEGLAKMKAATTSLQTAEGFAALVQGVAAVVQGMGINEPTAGGFGGKGEGNYAEEGSLIGGIIGGIIGAFVGPAGAAAGYAIGAAIGGILGTFIKKGADEALGSLEFDGAEIESVINKNEGGLRHVIDELAVGVDNALKGLLTALNATLIGLPNISIKVRDGVVSVLVGAIYKKFQSVDDAISFAVTEILKQGDIIGLSDVIKKILAGTDAKDLQELTADLNFGKWFEQLGMDQVGVAIDQLAGQFRMALQQAQKFGLEIDKVGAWFNDQLTTLRNNILQIEEDPEAAARRQVAAFNAQVTMLRAEAELRKAEILSRKAKLEADIEVMKAELALERERLSLRKDFLDVDVAIVSAQGAALQSALGMLKGLTDALAGLDLLLGSLPDLISDEELEKLLKKLKRLGGAGGSRGADRDRVKDELEDIRRSSLSDFSRSLLEMQDRMKKLTEEAKKLGISEEDLAKARAILLEQLKQSLRDQVTPYLRTGSQFDQQKEDIEKKFDDIRKANDELLKKEGILALTRQEINRAEREALHALGREVVSGLGLASVETRERMKGLSDSLKFLRENSKALGISMKELGKIERELGDQMFLSIAEGLNQYVQNEDVKRQLERMRFDMEIANWELQFKLVKAMGILTEEQVAMIDGLLDYIHEHREDFPGGTNYNPNPSGGSGGGNVTGNEVPPWLQAQRDALAMLERYERAAAESGMSEGERRLRQINEDFATIFATLGRNARTLAAFNAAIRDAFREMTQGLRDLRDELDMSDLSPLSRGQRFAEAQSQFNEALAALQGGDLGVLDTLPDIIRQYLEQAQDALPVGSSAYSAIYEQIQGVIASILQMADNGAIDQATLAGILAQLGQSAGTGGAGGASGTGGGTGGATGGAGVPMSADQQQLLATQDGFASVVEGVEALRGDTVDYLRGIRDHTYQTSVEVRGVRERLDQPLIASIR